MTTATATAAAGTKGRKVTVNFEDGRTVTFTDKNSAFLCVALHDGEDGIIKGSATREGALKGDPQRGLNNGVWSNLRVVEVIEA